MAEKSSQDLSDVSLPTDESDKALENLSDAEIIRYIEKELKKSQLMVKSKFNTIDKSLNDLYCRTLESIMKIYKSNKSKSTKKPWEEFREAADHLSEMHKYMKTEIVELYALSQRRGSLACSRALLDSLCPQTASSALPVESSHDCESHENQTLQNSGKHTNSRNTCKNRYVSRALIASQIRFDWKNSNRLKRIAPAGGSPTNYRSSSPDCSQRDKLLEAQSSAGLVDSSSDDEDELLENEIKRRRTDHEWR